MPKSSKETRIKKEADRLREVFSGLDENKMQVVDSLIQRAAFITISLEDVEAILIRDGFVEEYQNGANQNGLKKSAAADVHISLTKNLVSISKQLVDIVPPSQRKSKLAEMMNR